MNRDLPSADRRQVRRAALRLVRRDAPGFTATLLLNSLAAAAALVSPWLLGRIIDSISAGGTVDLLAAIAVGAALAQLVLSRYAEKIGTRFSERVQEHIRAELLERVLALPAVTVEHVRTGDLTARGTTDVAVVGRTLRDAAPAILVSSLQALFLIVAVFLVDPVLGACGLLALAGIVAASRWYLRRARPAYLEEGAARSELAEHLGANAAGAPNALSPPSWRGGPSSRSPTACTRPATPTEWWSWTTAGWWRSEPTTSWSPRAGCTRRCGGRGTAREVSAPNTILPALTDRQRRPRIRPGPHPHQRRLPPAPSTPHGQRRDRQGEPDHAEAEANPPSNRLGTSPRFGTMTDVRVGLLGPFEVRNLDGAVVEVPGIRLRALLAALALEPGRIVTRARLVDWIWGQRPPADEVNALQALVSRLRRVLPDGVIEAESGGYRLAVAPDAVDVCRFEHLVGQARAAEPAARADLLRSALALWRGTAMADIALRDSDAFDATVARLDELYVAALGDRVEADIRLGRGSELVSELTELVATYPMREGFVAALMRALAEAGRGTEALTVYQRTRERLAEELGADPSAELSALHTALLRGELGERAENRRTNLRAELTSFVGKDDDISAVAGLAIKHRLVTLTGAGGSGKTRLATETARTMLAELPDGAWLVELASVRAGGELAQAALTAIGLRDQALLGGARGGEPMDRLIAAVRERAILLILDNCEHVIEAAAAFTDRLLGECRRLRILATSREPLGITGEVLWQVGPLALPAKRADLAELGSSPAVRLLRDRAALVRKDIGSDAHTLSAMARICRALDGMPLAIELAAARLRTMSIDQLAHRLDDRFRLLTGGSRTALARHKTLRAVVDWSWDLLTEAERGVLRRLSVFSGGASLEAAERVCGDEAFAGEQVLDVLTALIEKSLLLADGEGTPRYRMLDTIREYAAHRLAEAGETEPARRAHLAYFTELAETADPHLRRAEQLEWLSTLEAEHDNISAALRGAIAAGWAQEAMRLVGAVGWYWFLSGRRAEGTELSIAAASLHGEVSDEVRAMAYTIVTVFVTSWPGRDQYQAREWIHEAHRFTQRSGYRHPMLGFVALWERMLQEPTEFLPAFEPLIADDDPWVRAQARLTRGRLRLTLGGDETDVDVDAGIALAEFRTLGDRWGISSALTFLADRSAMRGEFARACEHYEEAAVALTEVGATEDVVGLRTRQAQLYWLLGDERSSTSAMTEAQRYAGEIAWPETIAELALMKAHLARWRGEPDKAHQHLATVRAMLGNLDNLGNEELSDMVRAKAMNLYGYLTEDLDKARAHRSEAFRAAAETMYPPLIAEVLIGIADLALRQGQYEQAVRLLAASDGVRGTPDRSQPDVSRIAADTRNRLGETVFAEVTRAGQRRDWRELAEITLAS